MFQIAHFNQRDSSVVMDIPEMCYSGTDIVGEEGVTTTSVEEDRDMHARPVLFPTSSADHWLSWMLPMRHWAEGHALQRVLDEFALIGLNIKLQATADFETFAYENKQAELDYYNFQDITLYTLIPFVEALIAEGEHGIPYDFRKVSYAYATRHYQDITTTVSIPPTTTNQWPYVRQQNASYCERLHRHVLFILQRHVYIIVWTLSHLKIDPISNTEAKRRFVAFSNNLIMAFPAHYADTVVYPDLLDQGPQEVWFHQLRLKYGLLDMCQRLTRNMASVMQKLACLSVAEQLMFEDDTILSFTNWHDAWKVKVTEITVQSFFPYDWSEMLFRDFILSMEFCKQMVLAQVHKEKTLRRQQLYRTTRSHTGSY